MNEIATAMIGLTPDVKTLAVARHGVLRVAFADGLAGEVEVLDRMRGPVFGKLAARRVREGARR